MARVVALAQYRGSVRLTMPVTITRTIIRIVRIRIGRILIINTTWASETRSLGLAEFQPNGLASGVLSGLTTKQERHIGVRAQVGLR